jgi:hypothetical protein
VKIKALSLTQPWANMIAAGQKTIETRRWKPAYRGLLLICATRQRVLGCEGPYGKAVAIVDLADVRPMIEADEAKACCDLYPGAYAWRLYKITPLGPEEQFDVRGQPSLFEVELPPPIASRLRRLEP